MEVLDEVMAVVETGSRPTGGADSGTFGLPSLGGENLRLDGTLDLQAVRRIPDRFFSSMRTGHLKPRDVLINKDGAQTGKVARYRGEFPDAAINEHLFLLRGTNSIRQDYLFHVLLSEETQRTIRGLITGSAQPGLNRSFLKAAWIPLPSLEEQRCIAEILDTIDENIQATERVLAKLTVTRVGLLHEQLAAGMSMSPPPEWEVVRVEEILGHRDPAMRSGPFGSTLLASELVNEGVPLLGIDNVQREQFVADYRRFVAPAKAHELRRYRVFPGDLMITIMGTVGRCCVVPDSVGEALSSKHVWTLTLNPDRYLPELACLQMNYSSWALAHFGRDEQGGIMSAIRSETLRSLRLPTPPMAEQRRILAVLDAATCRIEAQAAAMSKLRELRSGLAADLLSGRVRTVSGVSSGPEWEKVERPLLDHLSSLGWQTLIWSERQAEGVDVTGVGSRCAP